MERCLELPWWEIANISDRKPLQPIPNFLRTLYWKCNNKYGIDTTLPVMRSSHQSFAKPFPFTVSNRFFKVSCRFVPKQAFNKPVYNNYWKFRFQQLQIRFLKEIVWRYKAFYEKIIQEIFTGLRPTLEISFNSVHCLQKALKYYGMGGTQNRG